MKKLSRIVTLFLALALVFSMSAVALADNVPGIDGGANVCDVKINVAIKPFAEWTFPSEIIITIAPKDNTYEATIAPYNIVVSNALIKSNQKLVFGLLEHEEMFSAATVSFTEAPLISAIFKVGDNYYASGMNDEAFIEARFTDDSWIIPVNLYQYIVNDNWSGVSGHIILDGANGVFTAEEKLNFQVAFEDNFIPG